MQLKCDDCQHVIELSDPEAKDLRYEMDCPLCGGYACNWQLVSRTLRGSASLQPGQQEPWNHSRGRPESSKSHQAAVRSPPAMAVRRQLLLESLQHPVALAFLAVSGLAIIYLLLLSPILVKRVWALVGLFVSVGAAGVAILWRYAALRSREYDQRLETIVGQREQEQLDERYQSLRTGFSDIDAVEGLKAVAALSHEYEQLQGVLSSEVDADPVSAASLTEPAVEALHQGLSALEDALEVKRTARSGTTRLQKKISDLKADIQNAGSGGVRAERLCIKRDTLASHLQRLELLEKLQLRVDQLMYQAGRCEASLHRTRLELVTIKTGSSQTSVDSVIDALQGTIRQAEEVQEELRNLGY